MHTKPFPIIYLQKNKAVTWFKSKRNILSISYASTSRQIVSRYFYSLHRVLYLYDLRSSTIPFRYYILLFSMVYLLETAITLMTLSSAMCLDELSNSSLYILSVSDHCDLEYKARSVQIARISFEDMIFVFLICGISIIIVAISLSSVLRYNTTV